MFIERIIDDCVWTIKSTNTQIFLKKTDDEKYETSALASNDIIKYMSLFMDKNVVITRCYKSIQFTKNSKHLNFTLRLEIYHMVININWNDELMDVDFNENKKDVVLQSNLHTVKFILINDNRIKIEVYDNCTKEYQYTQILTNKIKSVDYDISLSCIGLLNYLKKCRFDVNYKELFMNCKIMNEKVLFCVKLESVKEIDEEIKALTK